MNDKDKKQSKGIDYRIVSAKKQEGLTLDI